MGYNGYTEKRKETNKRHMDKLQRIVLWCYPGEKEEIDRKAAEAGKSTNAYCKDILLGRTN